MRSTTNLQKRTKGRGIKSGHCTRLVDLSELGRGFGLLLASTRKINGMSKTGLFGSFARAGLRESPHLCFEIFYWRA